MRPSVAICVVTYNSGALIRDLVACLPDGAADVDWTLVFSDNASTDDTLVKIKEHAPHATVTKNPGNLGYSGGINAAVRAAGAHDAYLILNADVRLDPGCVAALFDSVAPDVGIVVPLLRDAKGRRISSLRRAPTIARAWADALVGAERVGRIARLAEMVTQDAAYEEAHVVDWAEGSTQLISAACWQACGEWDESYFLYSEETEYDLRAGRRGFATWYQPKATAQHLEGGSSNARQWSLLVANRIKLYRQTHNRISTAVFWAAVVVREGSRALLGKPTSRAAFRDVIRLSRLRQARGPEWLADVAL